MKKLMKALLVTGIGVGLTLGGGCLDKAQEVLCTINPDASSCSNRISIDVPDIGDFF